MKQTIFIIMTLFFSCLAMAQVGVGTESPASGIEIQGSIRFRNLEEGDLKIFNKEVLMDKEGNLGYLEIESNRSYFVKMVYDQMKKQVILNKTNQSKDLLLEVELELLPNTISVFEIHYNVPVSFEMVNQTTYTDIPLVSDIGVRLMKKEEGKESSYVNLREGNRAVSLIDEYEKASPNLNFRRSFIEGMNVQEVVNKDNKQKKISYKLMSYVNDNQGEVRYGSQENNDGMGVGMILVKVYHKPYYK
ncbi:hypothetical protein HX049_17435 [Myroides odoratimimus]|uniref:hypothetical protein n=1 Tax=Myroides odoratimimus TaxID=76832 RepID=UPI002575BFCE|nr:hypothetical protein [Myroides odoratimimus]MDM1398924.1 hypothetical protein [Myroides odoratimimus]